METRGTDHEQNRWNSCSQGRRKIFAASREILPLSREHKRMPAGLIDLKNGTSYDNSDLYELLGYAMYNSSHINTYDLLKNLMDYLCVIFFGF